MSKFGILRESFEEIPNWCKTITITLYRKSKEIPFASKVATEILLLDKSGKKVFINKNNIKKSNHAYAGFNKSLSEWLKILKDSYKLNDDEIEITLSDEKLIDDTRYHKILQTEMVSNDEMHGYKTKTKSKVNKPKCKSFPKLNVEGMF